MAQASKKRRRHRPRRSTAEGRTTSARSGADVDELEGADSPSQFPALEWAVELLELLVVIGLGILVIIATGFLIWEGTAVGIPTTRPYVVLKMLHDNWIGALILMVVLFYRPISAYLARMEKFWGTEASPRKPKAGENPSDDGGAS